MNEDSDKTVARSWKMPLKAAPGNASEYGANVLPIGTHLGEFEILDLIGEGGFGIVYLAYDHSLERRVALKEYMPSGLATRTAKMTVTVRSQHNAGTFTAGLKSFINEARMLAQFDSPSLVKVHRFWEGNGTAYMVMPFYEGVTLKQALKERRVTPTEPWVRVLLADLFDAIETIHRAQCFHRDIAPDNILLLKDDRPLLLDFGAARRVIGDLTQCLTVILKPGFAPIEQYADIVGLRQGAWTDIYALAAVVYYLITGRAPPPAVARFVHDDMVPAREAGKGRYSDAFLAVLDKALAVKPEQRFKSIAELRRALDIMETVPRTLPRTVSHWSASNAPTIPMAEAEAKPAAKPGAKPVAQPNVKPNVQPPQRPVAPDRNWQKLHGINVPEGRSKPGKPAWPILGLLLSAGIAAGMYWGTQRSWDESAERSSAASGPAPVSESSGSGEMPEREAADQALAIAPPAPALPPVVEKPIQRPEPTPDANPAATAPQPDRAPDTPPAKRAPSDEELWRIASASDKTREYENYLREYPKGRHASMARARIESKQPKIVMSAPSAATPPTAPQNAKPNAAPDADARRAAAPSTDEELWATALTLNQAPAYEAYLNKYPDGRHASSAKDRLASFKPAQPEVAQPAAPEKSRSPEATPAERSAPPEANKQASIQPREAMPKAAPEPPPAAGGKILKLDGQTMTGDFSADPKTGIVSGTGKIVWSDGNRFDGTLVRGSKEGKGQFTWNNGQRYSGDWARDMPNGKGTIVFANGNRYTGDVKDGVPHGQGTTRFKGGDVYSGAWVGGKSQGHGRYTWANGSYWEGEFSNDQRTENGKMVFSESALRAAESAPPPAMGEAPAQERPTVEKEAVEQ